MMSAPLLLGACTTPVKLPKINAPKIKLPPPPQLNKLPPFIQIIELINGPSEKKLEARRLKAELAKLPITHARRKEEHGKIWRRISKVTDVRPISDSRIRIYAEGTLFGNQDISEQNFFIRAAAETMRSGHDGFVVMHLDYYSPGPELPSLTPKINFSSRRWIGNYEDFLENRNEQNMFSSRRSVRHKVLDGVILVLKKDDYPNRDRFSANEIYLNLMTYRSTH